VTEPSPGAGWPEWTRTIRFRLTVAYSALVFAVTALVVGAIYLGVRSSLQEAQVTRVFVGRGFAQLPDGRVVQLGTVEEGTLQTFEQAVNAQTLDALGTYSLWTLLGVLLASLVVGWWLSGRALRPVARITDTAAEISATDLSRRIALEGPPDELRRLADTIDGMLARLDEAFSAQRQLVDDASHELRNPLAILRATVDAVLAREDATPAERAHAVEVVSRAVERMSRLVDDLLATARRAGPGFVEAGVDLAEVAREAMEELRPLAPGLLLRSRLADGVTVGGDRDALRRAVANLLSNAARFSPAGGEVLVACGRLGEWAWVAVRDDGPGLAPEHRGRIFDRFYRVEGHGSSGHAGLGLAIVRQIVESHRGAVAVHSTPGRGAAFVLWLPVGEAGADGLPAPVDTDPVARAARR
jgi:signal transduction histidine kinase